MSIHLIQHFSISYTNEHYRIKNIANNNTESPLNFIKFGNECTINVIFADIVPVSNLWNMCLSKCFVTTVAYQCRFDKVFTDFKFALAGLEIEHNDNSTKFTINDLINYAIRKNPEPRNWNHNLMLFLPACCGHCCWFHACANNNTAVLNNKIYFDMDSRMITFSPPWWIPLQVTHIERKLKNTVEHNQTK